MGLSLPLPLAGETASALRVHHAGRKLGDVARALTLTGIDPGVLMGIDPP